MNPKPGLRSLAARALRPPVGDWRFWTVQALVIAIALSHWGLLLLSRADTPVPIFAPVALYAIPVVYAALNFGLAGAIATAAWIGVLTLPSLLVAPAMVVVWAEGLELGTIAAIAVFVGHRVEREVIARLLAERSERAMSQSEAQFRTLFESSPAPILLLDREAGVRAANPAATGLFARSQSDLLGARLGELIGSDETARRVAESGGDFELVGGDGHPRYLQAFSSTWPAGAGHGAGLQLAFIDVSEQRRRLGRVDAYAASILRAHEEERRRIAQELHDEPVQALIHLCRRLDLAAAAESVPDATRLSLAELRRLTENLTEDLRRLARGLRPASLDDLGLLAAVRRLLNDFEAHTNVSSDLEVEGAKQRLVPEVELGLFRIVQEALRNVERHAQAHQVTVELRFGEAAVEVIVSDDGHGFTPAESVDTHGRLGLVGMQERAGLLGGSLRIESGLGQGTVIRATVPLGR